MARSIRRGVWECSAGHEHDSLHRAVVCDRRKVRLKRGDKFVHSRLLVPGTDSPTLENQLCVVTAVRMGVIFFRTLHEDGSRGGPCCFPVEQTNRWVKEVTT